MLALAPATPARADLGDCIAAAVPVKTGGELLDEAAKVSACVTASASDPAEAIAVATIVALVTAGVIPADTGQCDSVIDSVIAQFVAQALIDAGLGNVFGDKFADDLKALANNTGNLSSIPGLGEMLSCGCTIAGAPGEAKQIGEQYLQSAEDCADFFKDAGETLLNWLEDGVCDALYIFGGCSPAGGGDNTCYENAGCVTNVNDCPITGQLGSIGMPGWGGGPGESWRCVTAGYQCDACGAGDQCSLIAHGIGVVPGRCTCEPPYTGEYYTTDTDYYGGNRTAQVLYKCVCNPPNISANGQCFCPEKMQLENGVCIPCASDQIYNELTHQCQSCATIALGMKPDANQEKCVPACDNNAGEILQSGACAKCPETAIAVYMSGSLGSCQDCGSGRKASADRKVCIPACEAGQVTLHGFVNPNTGAKTPDSCLTCQGDTFAVHPDAGSSDGTCQICPDYMVSAAGSTQCTPLVCGPNGYNDPNNKHQCIACPAGQIYYPETIVQMPASTGIQKAVQKIPGHCGCPEGTKQVGEVCQCAAGVLKPVGVAPGVCICPAGAYVDEKTFACTCPFGSWLNPEGTECVKPQAPGKVVPTPPGPSTHVTPAPKRQTHPKAETPAAPAPAVGPPPVGHGIVCPPGMAPGPFGMRCFPIGRAPEASRRDTGSFARRAWFPDPTASAASRAGRNAGRRGGGRANRRRKSLKARIGLLALAALAAIGLAAPSGASAQMQRAEVEEIVRQYLASHPEVLGPIVRQYLIEHPEAVREALAELVKQRLSNAPSAAAAPSVDGKALVRRNAAALFASAHQVTLGNPNGDVTLVEFFDYSCGFCKRALNDTLALLKSDANLKIVLKDFPILGPGSVEAARVGVAVRMQDPSGAKSLEFHQRMLSAAGPASSSERARRRRRARPRQGAARKGHRERRGAPDPRRKHRAGALARAHRDAELCRRRQRRLRGDRLRRAGGKSAGGAALAQDGFDRNWLADPQPAGRTASVGTPVFRWVLRRPRSPSASATSTQFDDPRFAMEEFFPLWRLTFHFRFRAAIRCTGNSPYTSSPPRPPALWHAACRSPANEANPGGNPCPRPWCAL